MPLSTKMSAGYNAYQPPPGQSPNPYAPQQPGPPPMPPRPGSYASPQSPFNQPPAPSSYGSSSPYPQGQSGYNRPPPPPPGQQPPSAYSQSPYPPTPQSPYSQPPPSPYPQTPQAGQPPPNQWNQPPPPQPYGQQPYGQQPYEQQGQWGQPQQPAYGQPPQPYSQPLSPTYQQNGGPPGQPPQGQYGAPPPQGGYPGGPPPPQQTQSSPAEIEGYKQLLHACIQEKNLQSFYPPNDPRINQIAQEAGPKVNQVIQRWRVAKEIANDIVKLALYDIVLYIDDSGSMQFEEEGSRIKDLRLILERVSFAATLFDADGISIRFMNTDLTNARDQQGRPLQDGVASEAQIEQLMRGVQFKGLTPMGTAMRQKVIDGIVLQKARSGQLHKPVLVIAITDGQPAGEPQNAIFDTIQYAFDSLKSTQYGRGAVAFEFAQVGNDEAARKFLGKLDEHPLIGPEVDCTSSKLAIDHTDRDISNSA
ncbi:hypothetical protein ACJBU6_09499 [Exserohilum turcicum]